MEEIDLKRLSKTAYTLRLYLIVIIVFFICVGVIYSFAYNKPKYKSYTKIALTQVATVGDSSSTNSITQTDIAMNKNLVDTYNEVIESKKVLMEVIQNLALDINHEELAKMITTTAADNSTILKIEVVSLDAQFSKDVANEIAKVFSKQVKELYNISNVNILDEAEKPDTPYNINHVKDMLIFTVLGVFTSAGLVLIVYMLDTTIKQEEDIEENTKLPSLGTIPLLEKDEVKSKGKNKRRDKTIEKRLSGIDMPTTEAFRTLRTNLTFAQKNQKMKNILVTSSYSGEGKSYVSSNLAVALARSNKKIIIIDADMRKGRQNTIFKVGNSKGLSNFLSEVKVINAETVSKYIKTTSIPDVHIITSGDRPTNPSELLASRKMIQLLQVLNEIYDMVIIDGTPSILVSDSIAISKYVDNVIVVVAHKVTKIDSLLKVKKLLENVGAKITGVVLNKYPIEESSYGEKYYYSDQKEKSLEETDKDKKIRTVRELIEEAEKNKGSSICAIHEEVENGFNLNDDMNSSMMMPRSNKEISSDMNFMQYKMENISNEINSIKNLFIQYVMNNKSISVAEFNELKRDLENIKDAVNQNNSIDINKELREELNNIKEVTTELAKQQADNKEKVREFIESYRRKMS